MKNMIPNQLVTDLCNKAFNTYTAIAQGSMRKNSLFL